MLDLRPCRDSGVRQAPAGHHRDEPFLGWRLTRRGCMNSVRRDALTPEALSMIDAIARSGSFAAAAREMGKVPSALTYSVRQLEEALDVLLFDRSSRQARLTAAGKELLHEGRRLLCEIDAEIGRASCRERV